MTAPTRVIRLSPRAVDRWPSASHPSTRMLRNLSISNILLARPIRTWRNSTGPGLSSLIAIPTSTNSGDNRIRTIAALATSQARLIARSNSPSGPVERSEEHTSELQSLMRISYAVFCLKKNNRTEQTTEKRARGTLKQQRHLNTVDQY